MFVEGQKITVTWTNSYSKYYQYLGYPKLKQGDEFEIDIDHVLKGNPTTAYVRCDKCKNCIYSLSIRQIHKNRERDNGLDICESCISEENYCDCECGNCNKLFRITKFRRDRGEGKFCSKECYDKFQNQKIKIECVNCGKEDYRKPSAIKEENFCSVLCANQYLNKERKTTVILECKNCKEEYEVKKSQENTSSFCSRKCMGEWKSKNMSGENSPIYIDRVLIHCDYCNEPFSEEKYKLNHDQKHFCSRICKDKYHATLSRTDEYKDKMRKVMISNLENNKIPTVNTKPQIIVNNILDKMKISYINEYSVKYYTVDNFFEEHVLAIEVMGDYWHSNPIKYKCFENLNKMQTKVVSRDKAKKTYIKNKYNINILYLWEFDIVRNIQKCESLIDEYISNKGILADYNSFNYTIKDGELNLNQEIITPYFYKKPMSSKIN